MKKSILAVLLVLVCVVSLKATTMDLKWTYDFVANPACTTTVTKSCVSGFEYGTTSDNGVTLVKIGEFGTTGTIQSFTQTFPFGAVVFYMRTTYVDASGAAMFSTVSLAPSVNITASPVKTFTVTITAQ